MEFKFVLPIIYINIKGKTQFKMGQLPTFVASDMCLDFLWQWFFVIDGMIKKENMLQPNFELVPCVKSIKVFTSRRAEC